jgi:hypothetical protein
MERAQWLLHSSTTMKVVLTKRLAERMNGVDVRGRDVGDVLDLPEPAACALVAEDWAIPDRRHHSDPAPRVERRRPRCRSDGVCDDDVERAICD